MQFPRIILDSTWPKHLVIVGYYNDALHSRENSDLAQSGMTQRKLTEWSSPCRGWVVVQLNPFRTLTNDV